MFINNKYQRIFADILVFIMFLLFFPNYFGRLTLNPLKKSGQLKILQTVVIFFLLLPFIDHRNILQDE